MNMYEYCLCSKAIAVSGFVVLVMYDHPWLGLLCFLVAAGLQDAPKQERTE
jgi:hypothetical protein